MGVGGGVDEVGLSGGDADAVGDPDGVGESDGDAEADGLAVGEGKVVVPGVGSRGRQNWLVSKIAVCKSLIALGMGTT